MPELRSPFPLRWIKNQRPARRSHSRKIALVSLAALTALALPAAFHFAPRLIWNASASAPIGFWRIQPSAPVSTGEMVLLKTPETVRELAAERRYIPLNIPLLKRLRAQQGDTVCAAGPAIRINGITVAIRLVNDKKGRPLPWWQSCQTLSERQVFVLMDAPDSFDGRYFGPVDADLIIGKATPLWLR